MATSTSQTQIKTVVPGEASESDDDESTPEQTIKTATIVSGEASESEEEEINTQHDKLPPLKVDTDGKGDKDDFTSGDIPTTPTTPTVKSHDMKPKYDTLLHRKLRERNIALRRHVVDTVHQAYQSAAKDLHNTTQQLHKSQGIVMDVSHHMRLLTNDLFHLEDKIDIITSCNILPDILIPVTSE